MRKINYTLLLICIFFCSIHAQEPIHLLHGPYLQNVTANEATLVFMSDKPSIGWVELAPDDGSHFYAVERPRFYHTTDGVKQTETIHTVRLKNLKPGTRYRYRVLVQEILSHKGHKVIYGNCSSTDVYGKKPLTFITADPTRNSLNFAMVNDIHGKNDLLEKLIGQCDLASTDLFLFNGDMVSVFNEENHIFDGFMDKATELFASEVPMYYARGNHETRGAFATCFHRYFSQNEKNLYYAFRQGPVCFVMLDCGEDKPDSDIEYAGITDYDTYRTEQAEWLRTVVNSPMYKDAPFKVVVCHIPPMGDWHGNREVEEKFMSLLRQYKPDLFLSAHLHRLVYQPANDKNPFTVLVNPNDAIVKVQADPDQLNIEVIDENGKTLKQFIQKK